MSSDPRNNEPSLEMPLPAHSDVPPTAGSEAPQSAQPSPITTDSPETGEPPPDSPAAPESRQLHAAMESSSDEAAGNDDVESNLEDKDEGEDDEEEEEEYSGHVEPIEEAEAEPPPEEMEFRWYILKVQVNREDSIREALQRRISRAGLDAYFGEIIVPTEDVVEFNKSGKKRTVKRKLYPGYIIVNMALTEETWFLVRETPGIGDFTGSAGKPTPMDPDEVRRIVKTKDKETEGTEEVRIAIPFNVGDRVRVKEGYFQNFEGDVESIDQANGRVTVMINIFGRSTPVELQHWQMERV